MADCKYVSITGWNAKYAEKAEGQTSKMPVGVCIPDTYFASGGSAQALCKDGTANSDVMVRTFASSKDCSGDSVEASVFLANLNVTGVTIVGGHCDKPACDLFAFGQGEDCSTDALLNEANIDFIGGTCLVEGGKSYLAKSCTNSRVIDEEFDNEECSGTGTELEPLVHGDCHHGEKLLVDCNPNLPTGPLWPGVNASTTASPAAAAPSGVTASTTASPAAALPSTSEVKLQGMKLGLMAAFILSVFML